MINAVVYHPWKVVVLKFDRSVLVSPDDNTHAVHQVYRYLREAYRVLVVVSSIGSIADVLSYPALQSVEQDDLIPSAANFVELIASGETASACLLTLALERVGIKAKKLSHHCVKTTASLLNAEPVRMSSDLILSLFESYSVLVLPGVLGCDEANRTTLLGRQGADSMALFVAWTLQASSCIFFVNAQTLEAKTNLDPPLQWNNYQQINFSDALQSSSGLIQHKALKFAQTKSWPFQLQSLANGQEIVIGSEPSVTKKSLLEPQPLRVALLGLGAVGLQLYSLLMDSPQCFEVIGILVDDVARSTFGAIPSNLFSADWSTLLAQGCDVVIDLAEGVSSVELLLEQALKQNCQVVTCDQAMMLLHGVVLSGLAKQHGVELRLASSLAWVASIVDFERNSPEHARLSAVFGGAYTLIADQLRLGHSWAYAVALAQQFGLMGRQATPDLYHADVTKQAILLSRTVFGRDPDVIDVGHLAYLDEAIIQKAQSDGKILQLMALIEYRNQHITLRVEQRLMSANDPLAQVAWDEQAVLVEIGHEGRWSWHAKTRGSWPTTACIFAELLSCYQQKNGLSNRFPVSDNSRHHEEQETLSALSGVYVN